MGGKSLFNCRNNQLPEKRANLKNYETGLGEPKIRQVGGGVPKTQKELQQPGHSKTSAGGG